MNRFLFRYFFMLLLLCAFINYAGACYMLAEKRYPWALYCLGLFAFCWFVVWSNHVTDYRRRIDP